MMLYILSTLFVLYPVISKACPGSAVAIHAKCEMDVKFTDSCGSIINEITGRVNSDSWTDPHNGGTYTISATNATYIAGQRVTGDEKYTDLFDFFFTPSGSGCNVDACSESQVMSIADFSTNYCNLHSLYCSSKDGCPTVGTDLTYSETYSACTQHDDVCVATTSSSSAKLKVSGEDQCESDIQAAEDAITDAGFAIADAVTDCATGLTDACNTDLNRALNDVVNATESINSAVASCGGESTPCYDDINKMVADLAEATIDITDAIVDCADDAVQCAIDCADAAKALGDAAKDIAAAVNDC